jgi:prephenate dehydratase
MVPSSKLSNSDDTRTPIVSFLGPVSSYTHQVLTLAHFDRPAWSIGLTDFDLAQAALGCFEADRYDYKAEITIPGTT